MTIISISDDSKFAGVEDTMMCVLTCLGRSAAD